MPSKQSYHEHED
ncbi:hypothetical protein vseg_011128 [Gypsophila vaccaria]